MITIWHNPRCSKSRQALALLEEAGADFTTRRYLDEPPSEAELRALQSQLGLSAIEMMRTKETLFKELGLTRETPEDQLIAAMAAHPKLIERPVVITADRAIIARPPEKARDLL